MDIDIIFGVFELTFDVVFILPIIYLIWNHFKDDRLLTK